jgi:hypothetical protein
MSKIPKQISRSVMAIFLVALSISNPAVGAREKTPVCHVGSETGPNGETYLDDRGCLPNVENGYFCPDAGKVDLIYVGNPKGHLGGDDARARHDYNGLSDYPPIDPTVANADMDVDHDGVDEGCELEPLCVDGERQPMEGSCTQYLSCQDGQMVEQDCAWGLRYDPDQSKCTFQFLVACDA